MFKKKTEDFTTLYNFKRLYMNSKLRNDIEEIWISRKHGKVDTSSLSYEVFGEDSLRKIKVLVKGKYLPAEFYSVDSLDENQDKILTMASLIKDSKLEVLKDVFKPSTSHIMDDQSSLVKAQNRFETTFFPFYNSKKQLLLVVVRPSGGVFYQRLTSPYLLAYTLSNQVGFLEVLKVDNGVYTSPDNLLSFKFTGDQMEIIKDFSE